MQSSHFDTQEKTPFTSVHNIFRRDSRFDIECHRNNSFEIVKKKTNRVAPREKKSSSHADETA